MAEMTEVEAREILGEAIQPDQSIATLNMRWHVGEAVLYIHGGVRLGSMELSAMAWWIEHMGQEAQEHG